MLDAHAPFAHLISPSGHVLPLGHVPLKTLQEPSSHLCWPSGHLNKGLHSSYECASVPSAQITFPEEDVFLSEIDFSEMKNLREKVKTLSDRHEKYSLEV